MSTGLERPDGLLGVERVRAQDLHEIERLAQEPIEVGVQAQARRERSRRLARRRVGVAGRHQLDARIALIAQEMEREDPAEPAEADAKPAGSAHPLIAPIARPRTRWRCSAIMNSTIGSMMPIAAAAESDQ